MAKIVASAEHQSSGTRYPPPFDEPCKGRTWTRLGDAAGLTQFGVSLVRLAPGVWLSQRHWHPHADEFVYVLEGEVVLVTDQGEETPRPGDSAGFKAGARNGHCLQNRSTEQAVVLTVGSRNDEDHSEYSDIDMKFGTGRHCGKSAHFRNGGAPF